MTFLIPCPNCGPRPVEEFTSTGEIRERPKESPTQTELSHYVYFRRNVAGVQSEWCTTATAVSCGSWPIATRATTA